ncbi:MAG TPA: hypothetical protein VMX56_09900 [Anaerolineales bacterium]|nr:hypothetical protein [Anaerolineales bacterium]
MTKERFLDVLALLLALSGLMIAAWVSDDVFERIPHTEDEFAYLWQAEVMAEGQISLPSPEKPNAFLVPFVVDHEGQRFAKYPPGWPAALSIGARVDFPWLVNSLLAGISLWLVYRLGTKLLGRGIGLLAEVLTLSSPMFLMLSSSLLSHTLSLCLALAFQLAWLDSFPLRGVSREQRAPDRLVLITGAASLGLLVLTRPLTAAAVAIPFALHGAYLLARGKPREKKKLLLLALVVFAIASLLFVWQWALGGSPFRNLYTLWWPYDRLGFGPDIGVTESGHNLYWALQNTLFNLSAGLHDFFGWPYLSWLFIPFGLIALCSKRDGKIVLAVFVSLVIAYGMYWPVSRLYGPRYYYEGLPSLTICNAAGVAWLGGWLGTWRGAVRWRRPAVLGLTVFFVILNILFYIPTRVWGMRGLYQITREPMEVLAEITAEDALIIVHTQKWFEYARFLPLVEPFRDSEIKICSSYGLEADADVARLYPDRRIYHYYPENPGQLYPEPRLLEGP